MEGRIEIGQQWPPGFVVVQRHHADSSLAGGDGMDDGAGARGADVPGRAEMAPGAFPGVRAAAHDMQRMTLYRKTGPDHLPPDAQQ